MKNKSGKKIIASVFAPGVTSLLGKAGILFLFSLTFLVNDSFAEKSNGASILKSKCSNCHALKERDIKTVKELWQRKGPDLFYAGLKYKSEWLESWLVKPVRIRPAGYQFYKNIVPVDKGQDKIDTSLLNPHIALNQSDAKAVSKELMTLKAKSNLIKKIKLDDDDFEEYMAELNFKRFSGCIACHRISENNGGRSGPEIYTAGKRLQTDFLYSYVKNPQAWDPKTPMPKADIGEKSLLTLTQYMNYLSEEIE